METKHPPKTVRRSGQEEAGADGGNVPETLIRMKSIMFLGTYEDSADAQNLLEMRSSLCFLKIWNGARNLFETLVKKEN